MTYFELDNNTNDQWLHSFMDLTWVLGTRLRTYNKLGEGTPKSFLHNVGAAVYKFVHSFDGYSS